METFKQILKESRYKINNNVLVFALVTFINIFVSFFISYTTKNASGQMYVIGNNTLFYSSIIFALFYIYLSWRTSFRYTYKLNGNASTSVCSNLISGAVFLMIFLLSCIASEYIIRIFIPLHMPSYEFFLDTSTKYTFTRIFYSVLQIAFLSIVISVIIRFYVNLFMSKKYIKALLLVVAGAVIGFLYLGLFSISFEKFNETTQQIESIWLEDYLTLWYISLPIWVVAVAGIFSANYILETKGGIKR